MTNLGSLTHSPGTHPFKSNEEKNAHLIELRMDTGVVYVRPSRWQRMRLRWVFRNFHVLPLLVLSRWDQRLIARLAQFAVVTPTLPVTGCNVFGVIDKVSAGSMRTENAAAAQPLDGGRLWNVRMIRMGALGALTTLCVAVILALGNSPRPQTANKPPTQKMQAAAHEQQSAVPLRAPVPTSLPVVAKARRWVTAPPAPAASLASSPIVASAVPDRRLVSELPPGHFAHPTVAQRNLDGEVRLQALIGSDGVVKEVTVLSGDPRLAEAGVRAVRQWRYRPYDELGQPIEVVTRVKMNFFGQDAVSIASETNESTAQLR